MFLSQWFYNLPFEETGGISREWIPMIFVIVVIILYFILSRIFVTRELVKEQKHWIDKIRETGLSGGWDQNAHQWKFNGEYGGRFVSLVIKTISEGDWTSAVYMPLTVQYEISQTVKNSNLRSLTSQKGGYSDKLKGKRLLFEGSPKEFVRMAEELISGSTRYKPGSVDFSTIQLKGSDLFFSWKSSPKKAPALMDIIYLQCDLADLIEEID